MQDKAVAMIMLFASVLIGDRRRFRRMGGKGLALYAICLGFSVYVGMIFVLGEPWPNYTDLLRLLFGKVADSFVSLVKVPT